MALQQLQAPSLRVTYAQSRSAIDAATRWLKDRQHPEGWWCGELSGDATLESYLVLLRAFIGSPEHPDVPRLAQTIRAKMLPDGGWALFPGGPADVSVSSLAYLALRIAGAPASDPQLSRCRDVIMKLGGPACANSYTRYQFAMFGELPWDHVPAIPPEMLLLPASAPFSIYDLSSWSRTIFVPLSVIWATKPVRQLPSHARVRELFDGAPAAPARRSLDLGRAFLELDRLLKAAERVPVPWGRRYAVKRATEWITQRLSESDGLGAILPAMTSAVIALLCAGRPVTDGDVSEGIRHLEGLQLGDGTDGPLRVQPCLSPVWDTCLATFALAQTGLPADTEVLRRAATWILSRQTRRRGDWAARNDAPPGGWYFEHRNEFYPDVDDTTVALMALAGARADVDATVQREAIDRGLTWMLGMQNDDGGFASFDRGNDKQWLTQVPFADHNAMIDPSSADITGRVLECLAVLGFGPKEPVVRNAIAFLKREQEFDGSWYGRWGVNYLYGTWQALRGLSRVGVSPNEPFMRRAADWLQGRQNEDGGWGESIASYDDPRAKGRGPSTPSQTAWAIMGLLAVGRRDEAAVRRGVAYLLDRQTPDGTWEQGPWTGTGFPKVFYLNYDYYRHYFPLMALAQVAPAHESTGELEVKHVGRDHEGDAAAGMIARGGETAAVAQGEHGGLVQPVPESA